MSHNSIGHLFRVTTWGESHGTAIGCVIDGCPPGIPLVVDDIQTFLDKRRPGHADFTYWKKYGIRDYRGGGRASARETAMRVAAGAVARKVVPGVTVRGALVQIGRHRIDRSRWN